MAEVVEYLHQAEEDLAEACLQQEKAEVLPEANSLLMRLSL